MFFRRERSSHTFFWRMSRDGGGGDGAGLLKKSRRCTLKSSAEIGRDAVDPAGPDRLIVTPRSGSGWSTVSIKETAGLPPDASGLPVDEATEKVLIDADSAAPTSTRRRASCSFKFQSPMSSGRLSNVSSSLSSILLNRSLDDRLSSSTHSWTPGPRHITFRLMGGGEYTSLRTFAGSSLYWAADYGATCFCDKQQKDKCRFHGSPEFIEKKKSRSP